MSACEHKNIKVEFDQQEADSKNMSASEIRQKWPRFFGPCPDCGEQVVWYASTAHYIYGDW